MADQKISDLNTISGANVADASDKLAIVDASGNETKAITRGELLSSVSKITTDTAGDSVAIKALRTNNSGTGNPVVIVAGDGDSGDVLVEMRGNTDATLVDTADTKESSDAQFIFYGNGASTFNGPLTLNSNATITGNLTVSGTTTTVDTTNLNVEDAVITLNTGQATPLNDIGMLFQRYASATASNYNVVMAWDESVDKLIFGSTAEDGSDNTITFEDEWMTITSAGNVGIGLTNPTVRLDVSGTVAARGNLVAGSDTLVGSTFHVNATTGATRAQGSVQISNALAGREGYLTLSNGTNATSTDLWTLSVDSTDSNSFYLWDETNSSYPFSVIPGSNNGTLVVDGANDRVGVGTTTPSAALDVVGNAEINGNITVTGTVDGRDIATDGSKLDGIEAGATADQTAGEIKTAYESNADTNAFTDAEQSKLSGIETNADVTDTANVTAAGALMDSELTNESAVKAIDQGLATTDSPSFVNLTSDLDLAAIAETKGVTAVDVFVYDTSKDSDGGAWRKRTQGTSWYNETLNTATRGSRREFPAVAVIVAETNNVTIYDGDDPSLPMWMVFDAGEGLSLAISGVPAALFMRNGELNVATSTRLARVSFLADWVRLNSQLGLYERSGAVDSRNSSTALLINSSQNLVSIPVNDVAMTVLSDAPTDPATGLPVPTIAVATDGGVSVISDSGSVYDIVFTSSNVTISVDFDEDNNIWFLHGGNGSLAIYWRKYAIPTSDLTGQSLNSGGLALITTSSVPSFKRTSGVFPNTSEIVSNKALAANDSLNLLVEDPAAPTTSMVAYTTSTYNTGWMNGDIKGAFLSDTDDTDLVGSGELVTNGTFDTDTDWTKGSGWSISGGVATATSATSGLYQALSLVAGKVYMVTYTVSGFSAGSVRPRLIGGTTASGASVTANGTYTDYLVATSGTLGLDITGASFSGSIDNVSVKLADEDRSVNANGLVINGTVTRDAVATGADLVAYSGFSASNYLEQPYNSDLDFGTGDFCVMGWVKPVFSSNHIMISRGDAAASGPRFYIYHTVLGRFAMFDTGTTIDTGFNLTENQWQFVTVKRTGTTLSFWVNGLSVYSATNSTSFINTSAFLRVGLSYSGTSPFGGSLALWRISATAPTADQILKIYNDEKFLFQENSQATLYGSSDAVTALAHDPVTDLLHVGTSAGRSVFQGLRRVDNTTDAVGTAISASNNLIVEE